MDEWSDMWMHGSKGGCMDGCMVGRVDGWMYGNKNELVD